MFLNFMSTGIDAIFHVHLWIKFNAGLKKFCCTNMVTIMLVKLQIIDGREKGCLPENEVKSRSQIWAMVSFSNQHPSRDSGVQDSD